MTKEQQKERHRAINRKNMANARKQLREKVEQNDPKAIAKDKEIREKLALLKTEERNKLKAKAKAGDPEALKKLHDYAPLVIHLINHDFKHLAELDKLKRLVQEQKFKLKGSSSNADK